MDSDKKSVLVTGALRGIGRAIAVDLAHNGYKVVLNYRAGREDDAALLKQQIVAEGGEADLICFDISQREECEKALTGYIEENGMFWGIILNAGICRDNVFPAMDGSDWDAVLHTNLDGFFNVVHPLILPLCRKRKGRIVAISSVSGVMGNRGQVNYSASKAGIIGAVKALAMEVASRGITVNAVAPGIIETDMIEGLPLDEMTKMVPLHRLGKPEEVAAAVRFLISDEAGYITRQVISVNGGLI